MFDGRDKPYKILQDVSGMYGGSFLKIWKTDLRCTLEFLTLSYCKNHFTPQEVNSHSADTYLMPLSSDRDGY